MNPYKETIQRSAEVIDKAAEEVKSILLSDPNLYTLAQTTFNQLSEIKKRLYGLSGLPVAGAIAQTTEFAPLKNVMGITVDQRKPISEDDMKPTPTEKEMLFERIKTFVQQIPGMANEKVLEVLREPKGEAILRGAAKVAGVENWREADLNVFFIDDIKQGIADQKEVEASLKKAEGSAFTIDDTGARPWMKEIPETTNDKPQIPDQVNAGNNEVKKNELKDLVKTAFEESQEKAAAGTQNLEKAGDVPKPADATKQDGDDKTKEVTVEDKIFDNASEAVKPVILEARRLKAEGKTVKEIAETLSLSTGTVSNYTKSK